MICMANQVSKQFLEEAEDNSLLDALDEYFGHETVFNQDQTFDFQASDLQTIFKLVNQCIFSSKLPPIEIKITEEDPEFKGGFMYQVTKKLDDNSIKIELLEKPIIVLYKIPDTNTFFQICDTLCHEMIHYQDYLFGPLQHLKGLAIDFVNGKQFVGTYDVHGQWFMKQVERFAGFGVPVSLEEYRQKHRYFLVDQNGQIVAEESQHLEENPLVDSTLIAYGRKMFNSLKSRSGFFAVEVKKNACYITIE